MKPRLFSITYCGLSLLFTANSSLANEQPEVEPLDEEFLEFIASMSIVDGEIVDSLDMVDLVDNDMNKIKTLDEENSPKIRLEDKSEVIELKTIKKEKKP